MATTVTYKGATLTTVDNQTKVLQTSGKWCEDDFTLVDVSGGGGITTDDIIERNITGTVTYDGNTSIPAYAFNSTKITSFTATNASFAGGNIFQGCSQLTSISMPNNTANNESWAWQIANCPNLTSVNLPKIRHMGESSFQNDTSLMVIALPSILRTPNRCFQGCTSLQTVDLGNPDRTNQNTFNGCTNLATIIIRRSDSICPLTNTNVFTNTPFANGGTGGTIYIPTALYNHLGDGTSLDYKNASNWATFDGYGTITWAKIEGSYYETHYADGTVIS